MLDSSAPYSAGRKAENPWRRLLLLLIVTAPILVLTVGIQRASSAGPTPAPYEDSWGLAYRITRSEAFVEDEGRGVGRDVGCACYSPDDLLTVVRTRGNLPVSEQLDQDSDFDDALWLFDVGRRGSYQLAVQFRRIDGQLTADVWQDQDGDRSIAVERRDGTLQVTEPGYPSIRAVALDGYWQRDGRLAPNFDLTIDDRTIASFSAEVFEDAMRNDGHPDVSIVVRGPRGGDPRSYDWRNVYTPMPESSGILRTTLMVREQGLEPSFPPVFPWYFLGAWYGTAADPANATLSKIPLVGTNIPPYGMVKPYNQSFPPIQVDWSLGRIKVIGELVTSRGSDVNWFTYSLRRVEPGLTTDPNFESPFSYYDLAGDQDGIPELQVRAARMSPDDPFTEEPQYWAGRPYQFIRYSWDQTNSEQWSYKLGLLGQQQIDTTVAFPEFTLRTIPYDQFPTWVTEHRWDVATFVAAEKKVWTTEGIYDGDFSRQIRDYYYTGANPESGNLDDLIESGMRQDYSLHFEDQPWLIFNPVDRQLHLLDAQGGLWKIDDRRQLRYLNLGRGEAFDGWQLWEDDGIKAQLYRVPGGLIYSNDTVTLYRQVDIPTEVFRTLPPTTTEEWKTLGNRLMASQRSFAPADLRAMFDQFGGKATQVVGGPLRDFRDTPTGVRFAVDADTHRDLRSIGKLIGARPDPGFQLLSLGRDGWSVERGTVALPVPVIAVATARALAGTVARVTVENPGTMDLTDAVMDIEATSPEGDVALIAADEPIAADGRGHVTLDVPWAPTGQGSWTIEARVYRDVINEWSGERPLLVTGSAKIDVAAAPTVGTIDAERKGWIGAASTWPLVPLGCAILVAAVAATVLRFSRPTA
jgi:hypothetical protein